MSFIVLTITTDTRKLKNINSSLFVQVYCNFQDITFDFTRKLHKRYGFKATISELKTHMLTLILKTEITDQLSPKKLNKFMGK